MLNNDNLKKINPDNLKSQSKIVGDKFAQYRDTAFSKFPLLFVLLSSFGLVATFYGFEKVIDELSFFNDYPIVLLLLGIITLIITGSLYKKLS